MMHPSTMKLVDRLFAMTAQGKIDWAHGETPDSLVYDTEGYSVILHGEPTNIRLTDSSGAELEKVTASDLAQTAHPDSGTYDVAVAGLLVDAQRIARGTESAISTVLQGLDLDGDGVVDIPMEDGLAPTAAEIADHEPDMGEDTADESGAAALADADVTNVSNAVASMADEVNQTEQIATTDAEEISHAVEKPAGSGPEPEEDEGSSSTATQAAGIGIAGLGAAGLLKAARQTPEPEQSSEHTPDLQQADLAEANASIERGFDLSSTDASDAPLQLDPQPAQPVSDELETAPPDDEQAETNRFVPPRPGEILSLSGLTNGTSPDTPIMAGTATTMTNANPAAPIEPEPKPIVTAQQADDVAAAPAAPTPPAPEPIEAPEPLAPEPPALERAATEDVEHSGIEAEPEETPVVTTDPEPVEETPRPSRFNPWI